MEKAWRELWAIERDQSIGVNVEDARSFFEEGWQAAREPHQSVSRDQVIEECAVELETARVWGGAYGQQLRGLNNGKNLAAHLRRWAKERKTS